MPLSLVALMGIATMGSAPVYAAGETDAEAAITKVFETGEGTEIATNMNFNFKFEQNTTIATDAGGNPINVSKNVVPIKDVSVQISPTMTGTSVNGKKTIEVQTSNFLAKAADNANFTAAGIYAYKVTEEANTVVVDPATETMTYSNAEYMVYVYVANKADGSGVYIKSVGTNVSKNDEGNVPGAGEGGKVDSTPGTGNTDGEIVVTNSKLRFVNTYTKTVVTPPNPTDPVIPADKQAMSISKQVVGDFADQSKFFDFSLELQRPTISKATQYIGYILDDANNKVSAADANNQYDAGKDYITFTLDAAGKVNKNVSLKHNQKLVFADTEVGVRYKVTETGNVDYKASATVTENAVVTPIAELAAGASLTAPGTGSALVAKPGDGVNFVNTFVDATPTGIIMNNLPFIIMIGGAFIGLVFFARKKKAENI